MPEVWLALDKPDRHCLMAVLVKASSREPPAVSIGKTIFPHRSMMEFEPRDGWIVSSFPA
jgi:hypothetical protein